MYKTVILHGAQATTARIKAKTLAEAIEGFSRQFTPWTSVSPDARPVLRVLGLTSSAQLFDESDQEEVHLVPAMYGGGGNIGKILIGGAILAAVYFTGGFAAIGAMTAAGASAGTVALGLAASMAVSVGLGLVTAGAMGLFVKSPKKDRDPANSAYFGPGGNPATLGTPIPAGLGRCMVTGFLASLQVDATDVVHGIFPATP